MSDESNKLDPNIAIHYSANGAYFRKGDRYVCGASVVPGGGIWTHCTSEPGFVQCGGCLAFLKERNQS